MGTDYHPASRESRLFNRETRAFTRENPPQAHYSTATGEWDGQLPHIEVAAAADHLEAETPYWPGIIQRMQWTRAIIRVHQLPPPQAAVLNEIAFRDGRGRGCTATIATIALDTGYADRAVRNAIKGLDTKGLILNQGAPGQKKILGLPAKNGELPWPTPAPNAGVPTDPGTRDRGLTENQAPEPRHQMPGFTPTPVSSAGVITDPGTRDRATPARGADITRNKQETEREEYINISLTSSSNSGFPAPDAGVSFHDVPEPRSESPRLAPTSGSQAEVADQRPSQELERIRALVVQNWPLLEKNGWYFLEAAIKHYERYGIPYLQRDLRMKQENLVKAEIATRTCFHCNSVHESTDQLTPCVMCNEPKCVSPMSPCQRIGCDGKPPSRNRAGPQSRQRR